MAPLLELLAEGFQAQHPEFTAIVEAGNSAQGLAQVAEGTAARSTERSLRRLAAVAGSPPEGMWVAPIAVDGIAVIVHADNPAENLTLAQLYDVFSGRVWHWSELGIRMAEDEVSEDEVSKDEITVVSREGGSGTRAAFEALVMTLGQGCQPISALEVGASAPQGRASPGAPPCEPDPVTSTALMMLDSAAVVQFVADHPGAIGYVAHGYLNLRATDEPQVKARRVKALHVEDVPPTVEHVAEGSYRLSLPYTLVAPEEPTGVARQFVDFCLSAEGQAIVDQGYVPVRAE